MTKPASDHVDLDTGFEEVDGCGVSEDVRRYSARAGSFVLAVEEISRGSAGMGAIYFVNVGLAMYPITLAGNDTQNERYVPRIIRGDIAAFALTESTAGSASP